MVLLYYTFKSVVHFELNFICCEVEIEIHLFPYRYTKILAPLLEFENPTIVEKTSRSLFN